MWINRKPCTQMAELCYIVTIEDSMEFPHKTKNRTTI